MKLLLKHLARSIRKKPMQPLILVVTLTLSIATAIFAFTLDDMIEKDVEAAQKVQYGQANWMIRVDNSSDSRFLFVEDVKEVLGDSARAVGSYELPLILGDSGDTAIAMATELSRISELFTLEFTEYGRVTESTLSEVAFISEAFAEQRGLSLGDTLTVETMGYTKDYRIEGISPHAFLASYDVMVDIRSVVREFAESSLLFAAIGDGFKPCGTIYVNAEGCEGMSEEEAIARLREDARFSEKVFTDLAGEAGKNSNGVVLNVIVKISVALAALLSAVIAFCCFYILSSERAEETWILTCSGVSPTVFALLQYVEVFVYWCLSVPLGILVSFPVTGMLGSLVNLQYVTPTVTASTVIRSALVLLAVCLLTTTFFVISVKQRRKLGRARIEPGDGLYWGLWGALGCLLALLYLLPAAFRVAVYVATMAVIIILTFMTVPRLLRRLTSFADRRLKNTERSAQLSLQYGLKNICSLRLMHNITRLCALVVAILLCIGFVFLCAAGWIRSWTGVFDADFAVANATDSCYEKTSACEGVASVWRTYLHQTKIGTVLSVDGLAAYGEVLSVDVQPKGNEAVISTGVAHSLDLSEGDRFSVELNGASYELCVLAVERVSLNYIAINCEDLGIPHNMLLVKGEEGVSSSELLSNLSKATSSELAAVLSADSLMEVRIRSMETYVGAGKVLILVFLIFSLIGTVNILAESRRARRGEFELYRIGGMSRRELRRMQSVELFVTVALGIIVGLFEFLFFAFALNRGMSGLGAEILLGTVEWFL